MDHDLKRVSIKAFRADENEEECLKYVEGHRKVLETYGVTHVTSANLSWMKEPCYVILVESTETGEVLGGGRVQIATGNLPLPIETAINKLDTRIFDMVREKIVHGGTGEYCGLWNSRKIAGYGIGSVVLVRIGIAILNQLNLGCLFAFCSPATVPISKSVGYRVIESLGNQGTFYYPKEDLLATALLLEDPLELKYADPEERNIILNLRDKPVYKSREQGRRGMLEVDYNLRISSPRKHEPSVL